MITVHEASQDDLIAGCWLLTEKREGLGDEGAGGWRCGGVMTTSLSHDLPRHSVLLALGAH